MKRQLKTPPLRVLLAFLGVPVALYLFVAIAPIFLSLGTSFFSNTKNTFVGFENYQKVFSDSAFAKSLINNITITALALVGQVGGGLLVALLLNSRLIRAKGFHRTVIFFPVVMSSVVIGLIWMMIYSSDAGLLNRLLSALGLESWVRLWLDDPKYVVYAVSVPVMWQFIGMYMVMLTSSIEGLPSDILESAALDGATGLKKTRYILLPMIYPTLKVSVLVCISGTMKIFDHIFVMTGGGPGNSSSVLALYAYKISFIRMDMSYGSAISICILIISLFIVLLSQKLMGGKRYE